VPDRFITRKELEIVVSNLKKLIAAMSSGVESGGGGGGGGGATKFIELTDTPNSYSGQADKLVKVNSAATGLTFGRRIFASDSLPTPADGQDGDIWFEY